MRSLVWALFVAASAAGTTAQAPSNHIINVSTSAQLASALRAPLDHTTIRIAPGTYELTIPSDADSTGVLISGRGVRLEGSDPDHTVIVVRSPAVSIKDCVDCVLDHVAITMGDGSGRIEVTNSSVQITNCVLRADVTASSASLLTIEHNEIFLRTRAISLCSDAHAIIRNNRVEGPGNSTATRNLTAVRIGCDAQAVVERNHLLGTVHGIRIADGANIVARFNVIERMESCGIVWDARGAQPRATIESNVLYGCGGPAVMIRVTLTPGSSGTMGSLARNIIVETGAGTVSDHKGTLVLWRVPDGFVVRSNTCYDNATGIDSLDRDVPREIFWRVRRKWTQTYRNTPVGVDGRHHFYESAFLTRYGRWLN